FFFSSRRRHTRSYGDWSSDVCSSDLAFWSPERRGSSEGTSVAASSPAGIKSSPWCATRRGQPTCRGPEPAGFHAHPTRTSIELEIGRASCRERGEASGGRRL